MRLAGLGLVDAYRRAAIALEIFDSDTFCAVPNVCANKLTRNSCNNQ